MARTGMANLILKTRQFSNAGTADYSIAGVTYWTDDQIQEQLDMYQTTHKRVIVYAKPEYEDSAWSYTEYPLPDGIGRWIEEDTRFIVRDSTGADAPSYTMNFETGVITFDADTQDKEYYVDCYSYDLYQAVADIWESKAASVVGAVDWSSDNHTVKASQKYAMYMSRAAKFRKMGAGAIQTVKMFRRDENQHGSWNR